MTSIDTTAFITVFIVLLTTTGMAAQLAAEEDSRHQGRLAAIASPVGPRHRDIIGHTQTLAPAGAAGTAPFVLGESQKILARHTR